MSVFWKRGAAIFGAVTVLSGVGYALWFDYERRHNLEFRKELKLRAKREAKKSAKLETEAKKAVVTDVMHYLEAELAKDPIPTDPAMVETTFTTNVELGERLAMQSGNEMDAAVKFYKALAVYPNPADLLGIYQRTIPETIYEYIVMMIAVVPPTNITSIIGKTEDDVLKDEPLISELE